MLPIHYPWSYKVSSSYKEASWSYKISWRKEKEIRTIAHAHERDLAAEQVDCRDNDWSMLQLFFFFSCMLQVGVAEGATYPQRQVTKPAGCCTVLSRRHLESLQAYKLCPPLAKISQRCRVFHDGLEFVASAIEKEWWIVVPSICPVNCWESVGCLHVSESGHLLWKHLLTVFFPLLLPTQVLTRLDLEKRRRVRHPSTT